jgi:sugar lactone lactonase YvrE
LFAGNGAGSASGDAGPAAEAGIPGPTALRFYEGELYIGTSAGIRAVNAEGLIRTVVPGPQSGGTVYAMSWSPQGVLHWAAGSRIFRRNAAGATETVAGQLASGFSGDGGPAVDARLNRGGGLAFTSDGTLYFADGMNNRIRRIRPNGVIETYAGTGMAGTAIGPRLTATFINPTDLAIGANGALVIADRGNGLIRVISPEGMVSTAAGRGAGLDRILGPLSLSIAAASGEIFVADELQGRLYRVSLTAGTQSPWVGSGPGDGIGDGGAATSATFLSPNFLALSPDGFLYISDETDNRVRIVNPEGMIATYAGNGLIGIAPTENVRASDTVVAVPRALAVASTGDLFVGTSARIARINGEGIFQTFAGGNGIGFSGDSGPALRAQISPVQGIAIGTDGTVYLSDTSNHRIRRVAPNGIISTIAGTGEAGAGGDGGPAANAQLNLPFGLTLDPEGNLYVADRGNNRIRVITPDGQIRTFAGTGRAGYSGDGGPATEADLSNLFDVAWDRVNNQLIATAFAVRAITPGGVIRTIAGTRNLGFTESGPAERAQIGIPWGVTVGADGSIYFTDTGNFRIRKLTPRE